MASEQVWVVAACFNEAAVISAFLERVMALPEVNHLLLIDDGSSDATVAVIRAWQMSHADQAVTLLELTRNFGKTPPCLHGCGRTGTIHQKTGPLKPSVAGQIEDG